MDQGREIISIAFLIVFLMPIFGISYLSIKNLYIIASKWKILKIEKGYKKTLILKILVMLLLLVYAIFIFLLFVREYLFPDFQIPFVITVLGFIFIVPYLGVAHMLFGLSTAVTFGKYSITQMLEAMFDTNNTRQNDNDIKTNSNNKRWIRKKRRE